MNERRKRLKWRPTLLLLYLHQFLLPINTPRRSYTPDVTTFSQQLGYGPLSAISFRDYTVIPIAQIQAVGPCLGIPPLFLLDQLTAMPFIPQKREEQESLYISEELNHQKGRKSKQGRLYKEEIFQPLHFSICKL